MLVSCLTLFYQHLPCIEISIPPPSDNLTLVGIPICFAACTVRSTCTQRISSRMTAQLWRPLPVNGPSKCGGCDDTSKRRWFHVLQVTDLSPAPISTGVVGLTHRERPHLGRTLEMARGTRKSVQIDADDGGDASRDGGLLRRSGIQFQKQVLVRATAVLL